MANVGADLSVAGKLALRAIGRRLRTDIEPAPDLEAFTQRLQALLSRAPDGLIRDYYWLDLAASQPPWVGSGLQLASGDEVSYFVEGRAYASRLLDIYLDPALQVWCKVGAQGEVFRGTRCSHSFRAAGEGELLFGNYFPNDWADRHGTRKLEDSVYDSVSGQLKLLVIRWQADALTGLRALRDMDTSDGLFSSEVQRLEQGDTAPPGWEYLWHLGPAEIYRSHSNAEHANCIRCKTHGDVGILQQRVDMPLLESSAISWRWCVDQLPSTLREDSVPSHDYLSLAVEFDNGRDITYYWSSALPVGRGYDCPLPNWAGKEYHVVVRSGKDGLGEWQNERRNLYEDYRRYMGEPPARIVKVWLIANSIFQRREGACDYADIVISSDNDQLRVL
ncbi:hypothetical protein C0039_16000 [Pseudohalioglobus lutimaris]|uniref:DUF3047 domain-containing protein n=1 Tax=Pseudohalioglobus lutimaris TaxID=1737061 RepID=A0A2N5WZN2_9GAMM|nr:hypothetical protein C0039_16000 [Pseudohalioglobus lutimaris]